MLKNIKGIIAALIATSCVMTTAFAADVACPTAGDITAASGDLNAVIRQSSKSYFVLTAQPTVQASDLTWIVMTQASGNGFDAAFDAGTADVKAVVSAMSDTAIEQQGMYICAYFTSKGKMNVFAAAPQQSGMFNPTLLNLNAIKLK